MPHSSDVQRPYSPFRMSSMPKVAPQAQLSSPSSRAFSIPRSTPSSSRSPSVVSWASFDTDYDDGLIIEVLDSDDDGDGHDSGIELLVGEYEDPPSDDEYWTKRRPSLCDTVIDSFEELSTSKGAPACEFIVSPRLERSPMSSTRPKRGFSESITSDDSETDKEDNHSGFERRTRRRLQPKSPLKQSTTQVTRGFNVSKDFTEQVEMEE